MNAFLAMGLRHRLAQELAPNLLRFLIWTTGLGLAGPCLPTTTTAGPGTPVTNAAFAAHLAALTNQLPEGFTVVLQPPFVVIGDEPADVVRRRAIHTVKWAVEKLKQDYFQRDPDQLIDVWLFRDNVSYTNHVLSLFHELPTSRFGYYSESHHALLMNIGTGGGTLVSRARASVHAGEFPHLPGVV